MVGAGVIASADASREPTADLAAIQTRQLGGADVTARAAFLDELASLVEAHGTLYDWAARQPQPRALKGRAPVYVASLPGQRETVVVRHAWHGGLLAPLTGDRYWRPSRAPIEMERSARLIAAGIPTAVVLGFARYDAGLGLCRVDVVSRFVPNAFDLGVVLAGLAPDCSREEALAATHALLVRLARTGVIHPDLNVKNILLARDAAGVLKAMMIDVDTIQWDEHRASMETMQANVERLTRSMRKWRRQFGCDITDDALDRFTREAMSVTPAKDGA